MARKLIYNYTFTPSTNTIVLSGYVSPKRLLLITNLTSNTPIYNFAVPTLGTTSVNYNSATDKTTIVLVYNCSSMKATDSLQIYTEQDYVSTYPTEVAYDPVNKPRVSSPQALIDTDFEYGTQISKWENLSLINNRPFQYPTTYPFAGVGTITMPVNSKFVTVQSTVNFPANGTPIVVQDAILPIANGVFVIESGGGTGVVTYTARAANPTSITNILDSNKTGIYTGSIYSNAAIGSGGAFTIGTGIAVTVTTTVPHGLAIGNEIAVTGITGTNPPNGNFVVTGITSATQFTYHAQAVPSGITTSSANVYVRPIASYVHRAFDGGVLFTSNAQSSNNQAIRQTRRYFRYQSGKGIQMSSGTILKPNLQIDSLTSIGTTVTVQTKEAHNVLGVIPGDQITIFGANESAYNGTFTVTGLVGFNKFTYNATSTPSAPVATGTYNMNVVSWSGAYTRLGIFEQQNGLFFEYDGTTLYAVRRNSTYQVSGKVSVTNGSSTVTQTDPAFPTAFSSQLKVGDFIILRGQTYRVIDIASDTSLSISPSYRGPSATFVACSKTSETKIPQSQWNLDPCDGTGPSGYNIDLSKMQMYYIDYSWYGAGFVRWGLRGPDGNVIYVHKQKNNNVNTEAYMRSGNLPARYESGTIVPVTNTTGTLNASDTYVGVANTYGFPAGGTLCIRNASTYEYVNYAGIGTTAFTGLTRTKPGGTVSVSIASSTSVATGTTTNVQIGQRVINDAFPVNTFVTNIGLGTIYLSQASSFALSGVAVTFAQMGSVGFGTTFTYSATAPTTVELAYPAFAPSISHWGTSVIMDGRYDDDKSLVFTYGQNTSTNVPAGSSRALFSIRVAPSVDSGTAASFGTRELVNRMQLTLRTLDLSVVGINTANILLRAYLNSIPSTATAWTNAVSNAANTVNSSLAQIADYSGGSTTVSGGEVTAGYWASQTASIDIAGVRDLGNCILGGGGANANTQIYPDGPDVLTIVATNVSPYAVQVYGRISWTEAQA